MTKIKQINTFGYTIELVTKSKAGISMMIKQINMVKYTIDLREENNLFSIYWKRSYMKDSACISFFMLNNALAAFEYQLSVLEGQ